MRLAFLGSPSAAATCLAALSGAGHEIALVVTEPDKRRGRGSSTSPTPVKKAALDLGLPVTERVADVVGLGADLGVVVAFGRLIKPDVLAELDMVNAHFSLLPRWRGAAPVERAILAGDEQTGVCLMKLEAGLDTGPVYTCESTPIDPDVTADVLRHRLAEMAARLLVACLSGGAETLGTPVPQEGQSTYAAKISPEELRIDWSRSAVEINRLVRVGRAWTTFRGGRLIVWEAGVASDDFSENSGVDGREALGATAVPPGTIVLGGDGAPAAVTGEGRLALLGVQPEGRQRQLASDWARGARLAPGDALA